ncbi:ATP-binding domain-containing protein, partial [Zoogloea sp.]|uniref:ATP-binding domain-containing protein n=1 Tax=Zoogloea sp. TaxID=49181 RepID=UPI0035B3DA31
VAAQIGRNVHALHGKLLAALGGEALRLEYLLYCPDYQVRNPGSAGLDAARIVDATRRDQLAGVIQAALPPGEAAPQAVKVHRFLRDLLHLEADVSALVGQARSLVTRVSGGLAEWARRLDFTPYRLRVTGTAGSGKTQLALAEFGAALAAGQRPLYVCFNRPLADHFAAIAPAGGWAGTFHMLCDARLRAAGRVPDFAAPEAFARLVAEAAALPVTDDWLFDSVIVDEGQDFSEDWRDQVLALARSDARRIWLEDPLQNLYGRAPVALPGWVGLQAMTNYRSPRSIVRMLQALLPDGAEVEAAAPFESAEVEFLTYADEAGLRERVKEAIRLCYSAGFRKEDVAIVSFHGRDHSALLGLDRLASNALIRFSGEYDLFGQPRYTEGDVLVESVYRFKGQAAPAVILAEVDFETLDEQAVRKLFVGATRAMLKLVVVLTEGAAERLLAATPVRT